MVTHWIGRLLLTCGLILASSAVVADPAQADVVAGPSAPIAADDSAHVLWSNRPDGADGRILDLLISSPAMGIAKWARIQFVNALITAKVPVTTDFYGPGTHSWPYWDRELGRAFGMLMAAIGAQSI